MCCNLKFWALKNRFLFLCVFLCSYVIHCKYSSSWRTLTSSGDSFNAYVEETISEIGYPSSVIFHQNMVYISLFREDIVAAGIMTEHKLSVFASGIHCVQNEISQRYGSCGIVDGPWGLAVYNNSLFVSSFGSDQILVYSIFNRRLLAVFGDSEHLDCPEGIAIDDHKKVIYVVNYNSNEVVVYDLIEYKFIRVLLSFSQCPFVKGPEAIAINPLSGRNNN